MNKENWGNDPEFFGPKDWFRNTLILNEINKLKKGGSVLDFGCGTGGLLIRLAKRRYSCFGMDTSKLSITYLRKKIALNNLRFKIVTKIGTERSLLKLNKKFDVIVAGEVLEHLKNDELTVKAFYKLLKKGGVCVITVPAHMKLFNDVDKYVGHFRRYESDQLETIFEKFGFRVKKIFYWGFPVGYFWDRYILQTMFRNKMRKHYVYTGNGALGLLLKHNFVKQLLSYLFIFDTVFNWMNLGTDLLLIAVK